MKSILRGLLCVLMLGGGSLAAFADVVIKEETRNTGKGAPAEPTTLYISAGKLRIEEKKGGNHEVMIFDEAKQVVWMIDLGRRAYSEMTAETIQQIKQQMEAQMAQMSPEERRMLEGKAGDGTTNQTLRIKRVASGKKVGRFTTTRYRIVYGGGKTEEIWLAPLGQLKMRKAEIETLQAFLRFQESIMHATGEDPVTKLLTEGKGYPVREVEYQQGKRVSENRVVSVERRALKSSLFTLPAGLKKAGM